MEDYYPDEIPIIIQEYAKLNKADTDKDEEVSAENF